MRWQSLAAVLSALLGLLATPAAAPAADAVFWTNYEGQPISYSNLDGSGAGNLALTGVVSSQPESIALDPADGKVFFANVGADSIYWAYLDGSGGGQINTDPVKVKEPIGIAIDRAAGRVYWSDSQLDEISYANLDGSGAAVLNTSGATIDQPNRMAIDPAAGRIYWSNFNIPSIKVSYANLDGNGGGDISKAPSATNGTGVALDPITGRVFWGSLDGTIESSALDGSGTANLSVLGATPPESLRAIAIDPPTNRIFWANEQVKSAISFANLSGGGGGDMPTTGANLKFPDGVAILRRPAGTAPPTISSPRLMASTLSCSQGGWAGDAPASLFYRAPQSFAYQWLKEGSPISGSTQPTFTPAKAGSYSCQVTATNFAGSASQTSAAVRVGSGNAVASRVAIVKRGRAMVSLRCQGSQARCKGSFSLSAPRGAPKGVAVGAIPTIRYSGVKKFDIPANRKKKQVVRVKLQSPALSALLAKPSHKLKAALSGSGIDSRTILLKEARRKPKKPKPG